MEAGVPTLTGTCDLTNETLVSSNKRGTTQLLLAGAKVER